MLAGYYMLQVPSGQLQTLLRIYPTWMQRSQHAESKMNVVLDHPVAQTGSPSRSPSFCEAAGQCEEKHRSSPKLRLTGTSTNDDQ